MYREVTMIEIREVLRLSVYALLGLVRREPELGSDPLYAPAGTGEP